MSFVLKSIPRASACATGKHLKATLKKIENKTSNYDLKAKLLAVNDTPYGPKVYLELSEELMTELFGSHYRELVDEPVENFTHPLKLKGQVAEVPEEQANDIIVYAGVAKEVRLPARVRTPATIAVSLKVSTYAGLPDKPLSFGISCKAQSNPIVVD